jgi:hypothetical protein
MRAKDNGILRGMTRVDKNDSRKLEVVEKEKEREAKGRLPERRDSSPVLIS